MRRDGLILSCEHGGHRIPAPWRSLFLGQESLLASHEGWDQGALELARLLSRSLGASLLAATTSRLLVDLNRSPHHPRLFSPFTRDLPPSQKKRILEKYYHPHRRRVRETLLWALEEGGRRKSPEGAHETEWRQDSSSPPLLHLAIHSFTPVIRETERKGDVGLLYDPGRENERLFARLWQRELKKECPPCRIRRNYPYRGVADGLPTWLRREFPAEIYAGLEVEINQRLLTPGRLLQTGSLLIKTLERLLAR